MNALEEASIQENVIPFTVFIKSEIEHCQKRIKNLKKEN